MHVIRGIQLVGILVIAILSTTHYAKSQFSFFPSGNVGILTNGVWYSTVTARAASPLQSTFRALGTLFNYFWNHKMELNVDAVFVTGMARDQLQVILNKLPNYPGTSFSNMTFAETKAELEKLIQYANEITSYTIPIIMLTQPDYYRSINQLCTVGFWKMDYPARVTDPSLVKHGSSIKDLKRFNHKAGKLSDGCLSEASGSGSHVGQECKISDRCWSAMTGDSTSGYMLIHQVMYLEVVERMGCDPIAQAYATKHNQGSVDELVKDFCAHAKKDVLLTETLEPTDTYKQDIFMEEALICGLAGFRDFFNHSWLTKILSWQKMQGCYGLFSDGERQAAGLRGFRIVKREEKLLPDECLTHKSAVAAGVLSQYIRYLLEDPSLSVN